MTDASAKALRNRAQMRLEIICVDFLADARLEGETSESALNCATSIAGKCPSPFTVIPFVSALTIRDQN